MPKRKLSDLADTTTPSQSQPQKQDPQKAKENAAIKLQTTRLKQQFEFGVTSLSRALKVATGFERQKLGRRLKEAKAPPAAAKDGEDGNGAGTGIGKQNMRNKIKNKTKKANVDPEVEARRIEGEIKVLKALEPTTTAEKYLFKQLAKTKRIEETQVFYRFKQSKKLSLDGPKSTEEANVTARLFMSNPVKNVLPGILEGLRGLFGLEKAGAKNKKDKGTDKNKDKTKAEGLARRDVSVSEDEDDSADGDMDMDGAESDSEEEDYSHFDARLAPDSEDEDEDSEDDSLSANSHPRPRRSSMSITPSPSRSPSPSQSPSISHSRSPSPPPTKKPKPSTKASATPATSTTFLPSLMMGGYWSGSEEEASDFESTADVAPKRKNRMGQQARRALWEKKYGASAKHVQEGKNKKGKGQGKGRDSGWDLRKGATGDGGDRDRKRFGTGSNSMAVTGERMRGAQQSGKGGEGANAKKKAADANKPLHPSWEAARKAKEAKASASFSGKKVVFD